MQEAAKDILEVEIDFMGDKKTIEMVIKEAIEIDDLEEEKVIVLALKSGQKYFGIFKGMDDETIMLQSLASNKTIGVEKKFIRGYLEQVESE